MGSATRESLNGAIGAIRSGDVQCSVDFAEGLFSFADALESVPQFRSLLTDPAVDVSRREVLVDAVCGKALPADVVAFIRSLVSVPWSSPREFVRGVVDLAVSALAEVARTSEGIAAYVAELFAIGQVFAGSHELQLALPLSGDRTGVDQLIDELFEKRISAEALAAVQYAATHRRGGQIAPTMVEFARVAAQLDGRHLVTVTTAVELTDAQKTAMVAGLEKQFGSALYPGFVVDPSVIGGVRAEVDSEVIDATTQTRLGELRSSLVH
ncbi:MAG TPA: hypothetical protein GX406_04930 [Pseudoclavibacter sp.]|nr:hypothetical protein [Pseudoclavibacter sp.]